MNKNKNGCRWGENMKSNNDDKKDKVYKKDKKQKEWLGTIIPVIIGAVAGAWGASQGKSVAAGSETLGEELFSVVRCMILFVMAFYIQAIIHEGGHLLFGLISGYQYESFRIGKWTLVKQEGKWQIKRFSIAGTGGQCLMAPPDLVDGKMPFVLYNLGGAILNLLVGGVLFGIYQMIDDIPIISQFLLIMAAVGIVFALINGIPMRLGSIDNDGYNAIMLKKDLKAQHAFWIQLKVNKEQSEGIRLKDMPEEWFWQPTDEEMQNSMCAAVGVFTCNRLMDALAFEKADKLMEKYLTMDTAMVGIHRHLLICDRIYCELIKQNRAEVLEEMLDKKQQNFMKSMSTFPTVIRTQYAYALLAEKNPQKAEKLKKKFEKVASTYPYKTDIENQRELIDIAESIAFCLIKED